jgi:4a-hydroxytetrahydrobiopterin dehydratase
MFLQRTHLIRQELRLNLPLIRKAVMSSSSSTSAGNQASTSDLSQSNCEPCKGNSPSIPQNEYPTYLSQISPQWRIEPFHGNTCPALQRDFKFKNFKNAEKFARAIGEIAEEPGIKHHPAIVLEWGKVTCAWWTHAINGVSSSFILLTINNILMTPSFL